MCFDPGAWDLAGRHLHQDFLDYPDRPPDQLIRWHFRQAVLANIKGVGEPTSEHDFPPGSDIMGDIIMALRLSKEWSSRYLVAWLYTWRLLHSKVNKLSDTTTRVS